MQDLLALDSGARMNTPGTVVGNWRWRFAWADVPRQLAAACRARAVRSGRAGS
jgi:4-alpha-glucanotransferase